MYVCMHVTGVSRSEPHTNHSYEKIAVPIMYVCVKQYVVHVLITQHMSSELVCVHKVGKDRQCWTALNSKCSSPTRKVQPVGVCQVKLSSHAGRHREHNSGNGKPSLVPRLSWGRRKESLATTACACACQPLPTKHGKLFFTRKGYCHQLAMVLRRF